MRSEGNICYSALSEGNICHNALGYRTTTGSSPAQKMYLTWSAKSGIK